MMTTACNSRQLKSICRPGGALTWSLESCRSPETVTQPRLHAERLWAGFGTANQSNGFANQNSAQGPRPLGPFSTGGSVGKSGLEVFSRLSSKSTWTYELSPLPILESNCGQQHSAGWKPSSYRGGGECLQGFASSSVCCPQQ